VTPIAGACMAGGAVVVLVIGLIVDTVVKGSRPMKQIALVVAFVVLLASSAAAQTGALVSGTLEVCPTLGGACVSNVFTLAATQTTCNQVAPPPQLVVFNPQKVQFADPARPTMVCVTTMGTFLSSLPSGGTGPAISYTSTMTFTDDLGRTSTKSSPAPAFFRGTPPAVLVAPTGVTLIP